MLRRRLIRVLAVLMAIGLPLVLLRIPAVRGALVALIDYMRDAGPAGVLAFYAAQSFAALLLTPIWLMSGIAGYVYGFGKGLAITLPGTVLGASATFAVGRMLSGGMLDKLGASSPRLAAIARLAEGQGLKITTLLRATPVMPQNLMGYLLATTKLKYWHFALGTGIGLVPATTVHAYLGSIVGDALALVQGKSELPGTLSRVVAVASVVLTITMMVVVARLAKRELDKVLAERKE
jgi:uncharacterized membrane protein YdjX (TVP38/TMEM64 family)